ncbi:MAG: hypothetical protein ACQERD_08175 [Campylobacterota bacterium]
MSATYGTREIVRNPSLLRIKPNESFVIEDKKSHKQLGMYIGVDLAKEFLEYEKKKKLLQSAKKIREHSLKEALLWEDTLNDGLENV